jgi:hypothetical protein
LLHFSKIFGIDRQSVLFWVRDSLIRSTVSRPSSQAPHAAYSQAFRLVRQQVRSVAPKRPPTGLHLSAAFPFSREASIWASVAPRDKAGRLSYGRAHLQWARPTPNPGTGLDWTDKYPSAVAVLANLNVKTAYLDGELCGVDESGLSSFAQTQAATDGESGARSSIIPRALLADS